MRRRFGALWSHPEGRAGTIIALLLVVGAVVGPFQVGDPYVTNYKQQLAAPSGHAWLGTDEAGRDLLARTVDATRASLSAALVVFVLTSTIGLVVGVTAGLLRGWADAVIARTIDVLLSLPSLVMSLAIVGLLGPSFGNLILAMSLTGWARLAKLARTCTLDANSLPYVHAARLAGVSTFSILLRHIVPAAWDKVLVLATLNIGSIILALGGLSFLGLGAQPPAAEWGNMLATARGSLAGAPWQLIGPGVGLFASVAAATLIADALRDIAGGDSYDGL